jgi:lysine-N-methylase
MKLFAPRYYPKFHCIADQCSHSCCVGWEIDVDERMLAVYGSVKGEIGDRIRRGIRENGDGACFAMDAAGRCPLLDEKGLCRIISELGEGYLCDICREHPRFYNEVEGRVEVGVGAACEAAAALILAEKNYAETVLLEDDGEESAQTGGDFSVLQAREALYAVLSDASRPYEERLAILEACCPQDALEDAALPALFASLEYLDEAHRGLFAAYQAPPALAKETAVAAERFLAYLIYRHGSTAETEAELTAILGGLLRMERLFRYLMDVRGFSPVESAVTVSEELEYSEENTAALCGR